MAKLDNLMIAVAFVWKGVVPEPGAPNELRNHEPSIQTGRQSKRQTRCREEGSEGFVRNGTFQYSF